MINYYDPLFRKIIYDHKLYLKISSKKIRISNMYMDIYKYRDVLFCKEVLNVPKEMIWIIKYINNIKQDQPLVSNKILLVPEISTLENLYDKCVKMKSKGYK